jgi:hypothetical protein
MSAGSENSEFVNKSNCGKTRSRDFNFVMLFADQDPLAAPNRPIQNTEHEVNSGGWRFIHKLSEQSGGFFSVIV